MKQRLDSLDALRGFDLILLVVFEEFLWKLRPAVDAPWFDTLMQQFTHKKWQRFSAWDLVMPLFMFMSGITIPYSLSKYRNGAYYPALLMLSNAAIVFGILLLLYRNKIFLRV